jgi:hypothetical protein
MTVFWLVAPFSHVEIDRLFINLMMEVVSTSEMVANFYETTQPNNPEDNHLHAQ